MADPSSFYAVSPPGGASFAAPLIGMALGQTISQYPGQYFSGQENQRKLAMANAFPNGMPKDASGNPDVNQVINKGFQLGGLSYAQPLMEMLMKQQYARQAATNFGNIEQPSSPQSAAGAGQTQSPPSQPTQGAVSGGYAAHNPAATGPGNLIRQPNAPPSNGGQNDQGADTVRNLATEMFGGKDVSPLIAGVARKLGVDPDQPLNPQQAEQIKTVMRQVGTPTGTTAGQVPGRPSGNDQSNGVNAAPSPTAGVSGSPAPTQTAQAAPNAAVAQRFPQPTQGMPVAAGSPQMAPGISPQEADRLSTIAKRYRAAGVYQETAFGQGAGKAYTDQADKLDAQAQQIREQLGKAYEPTPEQKNAKDPGVLGFEGQKLLQKNVIDQSQKTYDALHAQETQYARDQRPLLELSRSILDDPQFYSGFGAGAVLDWNRVKAVFGNQKAAMLQEALQKVTAGSVLAQINNQKYQVQEAGANAGRIFQQQVQLAEKAAPQMGSTIAGNRFLVEVSDRLGTQAQAVSQLARQYMNQHGYLDPGFDNELSQYLVAHPLFSKEELADVGRIAPPMARNKGDLARVGWQEGQPVRIPWDDKMTAKYGQPPGPIRSDGTVIVTHFPSAQAQQPAPQAVVR